MSHPHPHLSYPHPYPHTLTHTSHPPIPSHPRPHISYPHPYPHTLTNTSHPHTHSSPTPSLTLSHGYLPVDHGVDGVYTLLNLISGQTDIVHVMLLHLKTVLKVLTRDKQLKGQDMGLQTGMIWADKHHTLPTHLHIHSPTHSPCSHTRSPTLTPPLTHTLPSPAHRSAPSG